MPTILPPEPDDIERQVTAYYKVIGADEWQRSAAIQILPDQVQAVWKKGELECVTMSGRRVLKRRGPTNRESVTFYPRGYGDGRLRAFDYDDPPEWLQEFAKGVVCP